MGQHQGSKGEQGEAEGSRGNTDVGVLGFRDRAKLRWSRAGAQYL